MIVILHSGEKIIAKYQETKSNKIFFMDHDYLNIKEIRSMTIYREQVAH